MQHALASTAYDRSQDAGLVRQYAGLISRTARRLAWRAGRPALQEELWSVGAIGLLEAAQRFDRNQEVRFETFAEHRIRGAMLDEMRRMDHLPRRLRSKSDKVVRARRQLTRELEREPTTWEIASALDISVEQVTHLDGVARPHLSLEDVHQDAGSESPEEVAARTERAAWLAAAVARLPQRMRVLLGLRYVEGLTYREIGDVIGVSEARVCQLHKGALERLRRRLG